MAAYREFTSAFLEYSRTHDELGLAMTGASLPQADEEEAEHADFKLMEAFEAAGNDWLTPLPILSLPPLSMSPLPRLPWLTRRSR
jgi:hypothetical protein